MTSEVLTSDVSGNTTPSTQPSFRARSFQLTIHKLETYQPLLKIFKEDLKSCVYGISCKEICPTTNKEHIHMYVHFESNYKLSKKILSYSPHVEICKGSAKQNIAYIKKDGNILDTWGEEPHQGVSHTVADLKQIDNADELDWKEYNTWLKIKNAPKKIKKSEWNKQVEVIYICGPSGIGKSDRAADLADDEFDEVKYVNNFWTGVTNGIGCCIYDDFRCSHMTASEFINFIDYRVHNLNIKGGAVKNQYNKIIITTIERPSDLYRNVPNEAREQWMRRMQIINLYTDDET